MKQINYVSCHFDKIGCKEFLALAEFNTKEECIAKLKKQADATINELPELTFGKSEQVARSLPFRPKKEIKVWVEKENILITAHYESWTPKSGYYGGYCVNINSACIKILQKTIETIVNVSFKEV